MTPATIIRDAQVEGVLLALSSTGNIRVTGEGSAVDRWLTAIYERKVEIIEVLKFRSCDTPTASRWWRVYLSDSKPIEVTSYPFPTKADVSQWYPDATRIEPFEPSAPVLLRGEIDIEKVLAWVDAVGEDDEGGIAEFINAVRFDPRAREWIMDQLIRSRREQP